MRSTLADNGWSSVMDAENIGPDCENDLLLLRTGAMDLIGAIQCPVLHRNRARSNLRRQWAPRLRDALVVCEMALALVLLTGWSAPLSNWRMSTSALILRMS